MWRSFAPGDCMLFYRPETVRNNTDEVLVLLLDAVRSRRRQKDVRDCALVIRDAGDRDAVAPFVASLRAARSVQGAAA